MEIALTKGLVAIVDDRDYETVSRFKWSAQVEKHGVYAYRREGWDKATRRWKKKIFLHRFIISAVAGDVVDHVDRNPLNNTRSNIRVCTQSKNLANSARRIGPSGYRGVIRETKSTGYRAQISSRSLGVFDTPEQAALARDIEALKRFGEFATLNFPHEQGNGLQQVANRRTRNDKWR